MRKVLSALIILALYFQGSAQFGFKAGLSSSKVNMGDFNPSYFNTQTSVKEELSKATGFHAGPIIHISPIDALGIETGLIFSMRGYEQPVTVPADNTVSAENIENAKTYVETFKSTMFYIDIPLTLAYKYTIAGPLKVFAEAGPYLAFGIYGQNEFSSTDPTVEDAKKAIKWGAKADEHLEEMEDNIQNIDPVDAMLGYKRLDYGVTFGGGVEVLFFKAGVGYDLGLANINPYTVTSTYKEAEIKNRVLKVYLAFVI